MQIVTGGKKAGFRLEETCGDPGPKCNTVTGHLLLRHANPQISHVDASRYRYHNTERTVVVM